MTDPLQMMMGAQLVGGNTDPNALNDYFQSQKQQMLAQMLIGNSQRSTQTPEGWNSMRLVPKMSPLQGLSGMASALLGGKAYDKSLAAQQRWMQGIYGGQPQAPQDASGSPSAEPEQGGMQAPTPPQGQPQAAPQQGQGVIPGTNTSLSGAIRAMVMGVPGADKIVEQGFKYYAPTDIERMGRAGGLSNDQIAMLSRNAAMKAGSQVETFRPGGTGAQVTYDANGKPKINPLFTAPQGGVATNWNNGQPSQSLVPGAAESTGTMAEAEAAGKAAGTPTIMTGSSGAPIATFPAARKPASLGLPPAISGVPSGKQGPISLKPPTNHIMSPTEATANNEIAKVVAPTVQALNEKAQQATLGLASLSEMKNLVQGFNPGKGAEFLSAVGNVAMSIGIDPEWVKQKTQTNPGDVEAFEKQTAALASEVVKQMSNRVTQMEFKTYLANNPNALLTGDGLKRVISYMEKGFNSTLDQQKSAADFLKANQSTPERFITDWPGYYNQQKAADIKAGKYDSINPSLSDVATRRDINTAAAKQGVVKVPAGVNFEQFKKNHPKGTIMEFSDGSRGRL